MAELLKMKNELRREDFNKISFPKAKGYHSKTIAYSIWYIFRIEDIVSNSLIQDKSEIFEVFKDKIKSPIITTGNELLDKKIVGFSRKIDLESLFYYAIAVKNSTDNFLKTLNYMDLKIKFTDEDKRRLEYLNVVSSDEKNSWLIDYWCNKKIED